MPSLCLVRAKVSVAEVAEAGDYVLALVQYGVDGARDDLGRVRGLGLLIGLGLGLGLGGRWRSR